LLSELFPSPIFEEFVMRKKESEKIKPVKFEVGESRTFYPQYCNDCHWPFVSAKRNVICPGCGGDNVVNCYKENYAMIKARYGVEG